MPENCKEEETKSKLYSIYMRPWTLLKDLADVNVRYLRDLDLIATATASA